METWEEAQEEDGYPGGGRKTESREKTRDPEQEEEPGGTQATAMMMAPVEPTEGEAMEEEWPATPGGRPTAAEQVEEEPEAEMESRWARATGRIRRAKAEQMAPATDAETGIQKAAVEPERPRTEEEPEGRRSLTERRMVDDRPRRSRRDEGAQRSWWTDGPRWRGGS
ncbi:hypothetical protein QQF64_018779 [Cirrhinus molitorella]|uniref:Uncharacterized protein n=1 Tax=Cirrhinus molitorella TaxID=172907 RepID=A0ABR3LHL1_9TELE